MALSGKPPLFREVEIKLKRVPVCKGCQLQRAECSDCNMGYLQLTEKGEVPAFIKVEVGDEEAPLPEEPKKVDTSGLDW